MNFLKGVFGKMDNNTTHPQSSSGDKKEISVLIKKLLKLPDFTNEVSDESYQYQEGLNIERRKLRHEISEKLASFGNIAVKPLISLLGDMSKNDDARTAASFALSRIGEPAVMPLIKSLKHQEGFTRNLIVKALGDIRDARAIKPLLEELKFSDKIIYIRGYEKTIKEALKKLGYNN